MGHAAPVERVAVSGDGGTVASADANGRVKVWRTAACVQPAVVSRTDAARDARPRRGRTPAGRAPDSAVAEPVAVSDDGRKTVAYRPAGPNGAYVYAIVNAGDGKVTAILEGAEEIGEGRRYTLDEGAAFGPDGRYVAALVSDRGETGKAEAGSNKALRVWDAADGMGSTLSATGATGMSWSADGKRIATVSRGGQAAIWDPVLGLEIMKLAGLPGFDIEIAFSGDGRRLETWSETRSDGACAWDAGEGQRRAVELGAGTP
jgi:WD40 repeat protein